MKNVFKYLILLVAAGFCAYSCQTVPPDNSHVDPAKDAIENPIPGLTIAVSVTADDAATVTVTAAGPAAYISVLVDANDEDESALINPDALYAGKYEAIDGKVEKYNSESPLTLELSDLDPNTIYQVYAITASTTGVVGEVKNTSFLTTDSGVPVPVDGGWMGANECGLLFSEAVSYDESKPATAKYYAFNNITLSRTGAIVNPGLVGDAHVAVEVDDNFVVFTVTLDGENPLPDGACFAVSYPAGAFKDAIGNECAALASAPALDEDGEWDPKGLGGRLDTAPFELLDEDAESTITFLSVAYYSFSTPEGVNLVGTTKAAAASFTVSREKGNVKSEAVYSLEAGKDWGATSATSVILVKPAGMDLAPGDNLKITIAANSLEDIYGNPNAAFGRSYGVSFGYTVDDVIGEYLVSGASYFGARYNEPDWSFTVAASDDPEKGNIMITSFYGFNLPNPSYGLFDGDSGVVTFAPFFYLGGFVYPDFEYATGKSADCWLDFVGLTYDYLKYWFTGGSQGSTALVTLNMPASGTLDGISDLWGYEYDAYILPESGDPADIAEDAESVYYDYNFFEITPVSKVVVAPDPVSKRPGIIKASKAAPVKNFVTRAPEAKRISK